MCDINEESMMVEKSDLCMYKLESLCYRMKCAIIDHSLKLPSLASFRYYLDGIASETELGVVVEMLHDCWMYAYPTSMFDRSLKSGCSWTDVLVGATKVLDENDYIDVLHLRHAAEFNLDKSNPKRRAFEDYEKYFVKLYHIVNDRCSGFGLRIDGRFMLTRVMPTDLSMAALKGIYQYLVSKKDIEPNKEAVFLAIFSSSVIALSQKLRWMRTTKSGLTNYSCLFILMRTLASKNVDDNEVKSVITSVFCEGDGKTIDVSKLKKRAKSEDQQVFDRDIQKIISNYAPKTGKGGTLGGSTPSDKK